MIRPLAQSIRKCFGSGPEAAKSSTRRQVSREMFGALWPNFDPEDVPFLYYVLDPSCDGSHRFAETLDEHNSNVAAFRDAGRCQDEGLPT